MVSNRERPEMWWRPQENDHKRIGRFFIGTAALWLLAFVGVGVLLGFERIDSKAFTLNEGMMTQLFAASKTLATYGVMIPLMLIALGLCWSGMTQSI